MAFPPIEDDPRLTAYALGELDDAERPEVEDRLSLDPEARRFVEDIRRTAELLTAELRKESESNPGLVPGQTHTSGGRLDPEFSDVAGKVKAGTKSPAWSVPHFIGLAASGLLAAGLTFI